MSIQGNVNQGVNMATILYRLSPEYERKVQRKQTIRGMKENVKAINELQTRNTRGIKNITGATNILSRYPSALSEEKLNYYRDKVADTRELADKRIESAEKLIDDIYEARTELFGKDLNPIEKAKVESYMKQFNERRDEFKATSREYHKALEEYDEAMNKYELEKEQREKEKAEGIVHKEELDWDTDFDEDGAYVSRINKENKPVKENLSTTEEDDSPVMENYEASPEVKAAQSVMKAQQRSELYKQRMETARQHLRKQYEKGEFDAYEYGKAMAENDLLRRDI